MSFFKKKTRAETENKSVVIGTGGKIDDIVKALISSAYDSSESVKSSIIESLEDISRRQPELVLSSCIQFIKTEGKGKREHVILLLNLIISVLEHALYTISEQLAIFLINMSLGEMTKDKNVIGEWQGPASVILVTIGKRFPQPVWAVLIELFPPGSIPHYFVLKTMGDISSANSLEIVPNLKEVMARALPSLANVKKDNMRWVFAACFGQWCDAIQTYVADTENAPDKSISYANFSSEVFPAYEVMISSWVSSRESKVRLATINAIGQMCAVMPKEQFEAQLPKLVPLFLKLYSKEKQHLPITQGLSTLLSVCIEFENPILEPHLTPILQVLHPLTCAGNNTVPDNPAVAKNNNELLRCFEILGCGYSEQLCSFLLARLDVVKVKSAATRAGTLSILKHLITRLGDKLEDKKELILSGVKALIDVETSLEVRRVLCQVIIAMASQQYLILEGGQRMIEFVIKQSSISDREIQQFEAKQKAAKATSDITPEKLRTMCDNVLHLATTTVDNMDAILWPFLFEYLVSPKYTDALHVVCRCLAHVAHIKRQSNAEDYLLDFDKEVNLPKPTEIIVRLLVMLNEPLRRGQLGIRILQCLQTVGPVLNPMISDMWDGAMPKLAHYISDNGETESWDSNTWEDLTLRLLSETIKLVNDEEWTQAIGENLSQQLEFYKGQPNLKKCALKHMGLILQKMNRKEFIKEKLDMIFNTVDHTNDLERQGCAQAYGFCSASHMDIVLDKIKALCGPGQKKSGGLFSFMGNSSPAGDASKNKNTIFLCLGYVAAYASPKLVIARLDNQILHTLEPFTQAKQLGNQAKENLIKCIDLVAKALHPSHLQEPFTFRKRDEFIELLIKFMLEGKEISPSVRALGLNACSTLIHLEPAMPADLEKKLVERAVKFHYNRAPQSKKIDAATHQKIMKEIETNFNEMVCAILYMDTTTVCFGRIFDIISGYLSVEDDHQRTCVMTTILALLKRFIEFKSSEQEPGVEDSFAAIGKCIGLLTPRCTDPLPFVRMAAIECMELLFFIDHMLKTSVGKDAYDFTPPEELSPSPELRGKMEDADIHEQFLIVHQLSTIAAKLLPDDELPSFLINCFNGLTDPQASSSSGTCVMINTTIKIRGEVLKDQVESLVSGMLRAMETTKVEKTVNGTLHSLRTLATHHLLPVVDELLKSPVPHATNVVKSLQVIVKDPNLVTQVIDNLTDILNNSQILEEKEKKVVEHAPHAMSATTALGEIFDLEEMEDVVKENFSQIFCSLMLRFGTTRYGKTTTAADQIQETFQKFITCIKHEQLQERLDEAEHGWKSLKSNDNYHYALTEITRVVCETQPDEMSDIYHFILPYLQGNFSGQRVVTAAIFAEMISHIKNDRDLLQALINNLLTIIVDDNLKLMAIRGLGNIADAGAEEVNRFSTTIIDALMCAIDNPDEALAMEAMNGLARIFELVDERCVSPILVNICHRIRPAFEKNHDEIRCASFQLFGTLHRFGMDSGAQIFFEQIHNNLPTLFLHVNDENESVRKACKKALKNFAPLLKGEALTEYFNEVLDEDRELNYNEFLNQLSIHLITYFPERLNFYVMTSIEFFKSEWIPLRVGATTFIGYALGNVPDDKKFSVNLNPGIISGALIGLLKQKSAEVRAAAASAMSFLHTY